MTLPSRPTLAACAALGLSILTLGAALLGGGPEPSRASAPSDGWAPDTLPAEPPHSAALPLSERPLFTPDRRPPLPEAGVKPATVAGPLPPRLELRGIIRDGPNAVAVMVDAAGTSLRLRTGDRIGSWRLVSIGRREVTLNDGERAFAVRTHGQRIEELEETSAGR